MKAYKSLGRGGQVRRLKALGEEALRAYGVEGARLAPLGHEENTTFRVEAADGERYVVRNHRTRKHTADEIASEVTWLAAMRRENDLPVPEPVPTKDGALLTIASAEGVPEARVCVLSGGSMGGFWTMG